MALQPLSPPLPIPPPPSPSPSGGVGGVGQARGGRQTPTEDLSPRLLQDGKGSGCRPLLLKEGGIANEGSPARPGRGGEDGELCVFGMVRRVWGAGARRRLSTSTPNTAKCRVARFV